MELCKALGIDYPILQGPMGGNLSTVQLASTISKMGGLGAYGAYTMTPEEIIKVARDIREVTDKPFNLNLWVSNSDVPSGGVSDGEYAQIKTAFEPYFKELGIDLPEKPTALFPTFENQVQAILDARPKVFSFIFGIPSPDILEACRKKGILTAGGATTLDEALALEAAGVDVIIASGFEAGGHRPSFLDSAEASLTGTFVLVQEIKNQVRIPVIATGGIADGKGIAAALALGADAAQLGTAFLACEESGAPPFYRQLLFQEGARHTVLTRAFTGRLGRGLQNRVSREVKVNLPFPLQTKFMSTLRQAAIQQEKWDLILIWSGQIAPMLRHTKAADLMKSLIQQSIPPHRK
jgi:nitronate monooxygenase